MARSGGYRFRGILTEDKFVPLGNDVGDRTPSVGLTERHTAVHASRGLVLELIFVESA